MDLCFYLGTHQPHWLATAGVPLFVSHRRLAGRRAFPRAAADWALDSGGFSELSLFGEWRTSPEEYPAWVFAPEIQAPKSARRADLICLGVSTATSGALVGHEVKVSRQDVMAELADLTKCDPWMRYCDQWYLVVPHLSLIDGLEIPDNWGIMLPPSGRRTRSMTVHRKAPALAPTDQAPALKTLAAWQHWRLRDRDNTVAEKDRRIDAMTEQQRRLEVHAPPYDGAAKVIRQIIDGLGGVEWGQKIGRYPNRVSPDEVIAALRDLARVKHRRDEVVREIANARSVLRAAHIGCGRLLEEIEDVASEEQVSP